MKKLLSLLLIFAAVLLPVSAFAETAATSAEALEEGQMLFHGYISEAAKYYVGVPAEWALVGASSYPEHLQQAYDIMDINEVKALHAQLSAENDILFAFSEKGEQMVLVYGDSDGVTSDTMIEEVESLKRMLSAQYIGIVFDNDCGRHTVNELAEILYIGAKYNGNTIYQYYMPVGEHIYVFTFVNVEKSIAQAVVSTFNMSDR